MKKLIFLILCLLFLAAQNNDLISDEGAVLIKDALKNTVIIAYPQNGRPVDRTVAEELRDTLVPHARIVVTDKSTTLPQKNVFRIAIADEKFIVMPQNIPRDSDWMFFKLTPSGDGVLVVSKQHLLYSLFCQLRDEWIKKDISEFENGKFIKSTFRWLTGGDGFYGDRQRFTKNYDPESAIAEMARLGCSHVVVNALAVPFPMEQGPPGEVYYRFYVSAPDFDQFVETELNQGTYPPEYLAANLNFLKKQAQMAVKYGLTPGMHVCNPRSVPESLLQKYPFLRGVRVDHPFRAFRPRYALSTAHPVVRWHYAEMLKKILRAVPELGFMETWLNDSGSGFEHTVRLYSGRNGGPYLIREWRSNEEIAEAAANNVIRYYRVLRDAAHEMNPDFHIIAGLRGIEEEENIIKKGMDFGIDTYAYFEDKKIPAKWAVNEALLKRGSFLFSGASANFGYIIGVPSPWYSYASLNKPISEGFDRIALNYSPPSLAPYDVNREVVRAYQINPDQKLDDTIKRSAEKWVGKEYASRLMEIWKLSDEAVQSTPAVPLYGGSGFTWNRIWVRPFVPDIEKIPENEREYYQKYIISVFNNPHNVDINADALWDLIGIKQGDEIVKQFESMTWEPLDKAITLAKKLANEVPKDNFASNVFADLRDRLIAQKCYYRSLRNVAAWVANVHGYLEAKDETTKNKRLKMVREMIEDDIQNSKELLKLWETSSVNFMPIYRYGETCYEYGDNFGELLKKKIELTEKYKHHLPFIDPNYMWRMPDGFPVDKEVYLKY